MHSIRDELKRRSEEIVLSHQEYLEYIYSLKWESRVEAVNKRYDQELEKLEDWVGAVSNGLDDSSLLPRTDHYPPKPKPQYVLLREKVMGQIIAFPERREETIRDFLEHFSEIGKADIEVIVQNFKGLTLPQLEEEFKTLCDIFGHREN